MIRVDQITSTGFKDPSKLPEIDLGNGARRAQDGLVVLDICPAIEPGAIGHDVQLAFVAGIVVAVVVGMQSGEDDARQSASEIRRVPTGDNGHEIGFVVDVAQDSKLTIGPGGEEFVADPGGCKCDGGDDGPPGRFCWRETALKTEMAAPSEWPVTRTF